MAPDDLSNDCHLHREDILATSQSPLLTNNNQILNDFHLHREDVLATSQSPLLTNNNQILLVHSGECNSDLLARDPRDTFMNVYDTPPHAGPRCPRKKHPLLLLRNATRRFRYYTNDTRQKTGGNVRDNGLLLPGHRLRVATHAIRATTRFRQLLHNIHDHDTFHGDDLRKQCSPAAAAAAPDSGIEISTFGYGSRNRTHASSSIRGYGLDEPHEICRVETESKTQSRSPAISVDRLASLLRNRSETELSALGGVRGVAGLLRSRIETGIDDDPHLIRELKHMYGSNAYVRRPPKGFFSFLFDACRDPTLIILIVCALLSLGFGIKSHGIAEGWYDGASILFAVMLVVLVTSISDYRQSLQFLVLNEEKRNIQVHVIRGGRRMRVSIFDLVVGDMVCLSIGDQVPADGLFVDGHSLQLDESAMTGESEPVHISNTMPFLLSGCKVEDGYGTMLVTSVGMRTEWGKLMAQLEEDMGEETPLQVRLNGIATFVGQIGLSVALIVFVILFVFYFTGHKAGSNGTGYFKAHKTSITSALNSVVDIFAIAVTIVVVAVPEGLPLAVTLSLAYAMKKMMADRALVRRLSACETMGSATTICTDKTGTLTLNLMTVVKVCIAEKVWNAEQIGVMIGFNNNLLYGLLLEGISHNCAASVFIGDGGKEPEVSGSATEKAVLVWGLKLGMDFYKERSGSTILQVETFNSVKKRAGVALRSVASRVVHVHWKGAAEILLDESDKMLDSDGSTVIITSERRQKLLRVIEAMASESLRCIAFGYMELDPDEVPSGEQLGVWKIPEGPLTLLAIIGMKDPCRPGVQEAVHKCQQAGIMVRMITGDNLATAKAIATECGIFKQEYQAVDGPTFRSYSDSEREARVPNICVMARSSPSDKLLMVLTLKRMGEVVAVTGDGTNDSPALHAADVGLAMGIQGTEVAKESSDIIILDDNFATVVKVVRWGRSIYVNIQKFIQFQLTVNVAALTINFVAAIVTGDVPLTAVQLLWVNLIMDTLGALALATEPPTDELLEKPPGRHTDPLVTNVMIRNLLLQAIYQVTVLLTLQFRGKELLRLKGNDASDVNNTVIFNAFVLCQVFNEVNARNPEKVNIFKGLLKNRLFVGIIVSTVVLQVVIVEFLNKFASTVKLTWELWLVSIGIGFVSWPLAFLGKFIPLPQKPLLLGIHRFKPCCGDDET